MGLFRKSQKQITNQNRLRRFEGKSNNGNEEKSKQSLFVDFLIYTAFGLATIFVCFYGLSPASPLIQENQISRIRIVAEIPFEYKSKIETEKKLENQLQQIPPVFRINMKPFNDFRKTIKKLSDDLIEFAKTPENASDSIKELRLNEVEDFLANEVEDLPFTIRPADLNSLYNNLGAKRFNEVITEGILILSEIHRQGFYSEEKALIRNNQAFLSLFTIEDESGNIKQNEVLSEEEALRSLRINLSALDLPREAQGALYRIMRNGMEPNLQFDQKRTQELIEQSQRSIKPVMISVQSGDTVIEPGTRVTAKQIEELDAYRSALQENQSLEFGLSEILIERSLLTFVIIIGAAFYLKTSRFKMNTNNRIFLLSGILILFNLLLMRLMLELGDNQLEELSPNFVRILPFILPLAVGPIVITILVGAGPGILAAAIIGVFNGMMQGNSLAMMVFSILAGLFGIYACQKVQLRTSLVKAGTLSGISMALAAIFFGIRDHMDLSIVVVQCLVSLGAGFISGIIIVGLLPIFEGLFKYTTDITLLELTDFNHPLLRKMQVEAPGSYHHSLMVANLSENAAAAIGANPLVCRVCALFHDIGKMVKPEYFSENQRTGYNPHIERNPSMSALVIKSHVKEGAQLAKQNKLPKLIIDVIKQHHGTSLIQYFYYKALQQQKAQVVQDTVAANAPRIELDNVNEDTYRYEGPIPQFTESAIIMLADAVEAASRSLKKVTPQSIDELLSSIFLARLEDGQLNNTPITFAQLKEIKRSFSFTLLNMLHARVEYPEEASQSEKKAKKERKRQDSQRRENTTPPFPPKDSDKSN